MRIETGGAAAILCAIVPGVPGIAQSPAAAVDLLFVINQSGSMVAFDPEFATPVATRAAMDTLLAKAPDSRAGYLAFANGICDGTFLRGRGKGERLANPPNTVVPLLPIGHPPSFTRLSEQTTYDPNNYYFNCGNFDDMERTIIGPF